MAATILSQIPSWVWLILAALIVLGVKQLKTHRRSLLRGILMPVAMAAFSLYGVISTSAGYAGAIMLWAAALAVSVGFAAKLGVWRGISWSAEEQLLTVPGSRLPLAMFLGIFTVKFLAGMALARLPELSSSDIFIMTTSLAYGAFSGLFLARGVAMWNAARGKPASLVTA